MVKWMNAVVIQDGFPSAKATRAQKEQFARRVLKYVFSHALCKSCGVLTHLVSNIVNVYKCV